MVYQIRLFELYEVVDLFVIYEAPFTQRGVKKPYYFNLTIASGRWDRFMDKIVHFIAHESELAQKAVEAQGGSWALVSMLWCCDAAMLNGATVL